VDQTDLDRMRVCAEQKTRGLDRVERNSMAAAEIVEGALRNHSECTTPTERSPGDGVDRAVATRRHDDAVVCRGFRYGALRGAGQSARLVDLVDPVFAPGSGEHRRDRRTGAVRI